MLRLRLCRKLPLMDAAPTRRANSKATGIAAHPPAPIPEENSYEPHLIDHPTYQRLLGGNAAGALSSNTSLGTVGNSIAGALGGGVGGQILSSVLGIGGAAATSGLDIGTIGSGFVTGGLSGGLTALVLGFLKSKLSQ